MAQLIAYAKANPGKLNYASSGFGTAAHLSAELFKAQAGVDIVSVSYKGAAPALQDLIARAYAGDVRNLGFGCGVPQSGTLRPLAVTTLKRFSLMPDLPTVAELGLPGFDATTWHGWSPPPPPLATSSRRSTVPPCRRLPTPTRCARSTTSGWKSAPARRSSSPPTSRARCRNGRRW